MAINKNLHPFQRTDIGLVAQGADIYKASRNGTAYNGLFVLLDAGVNMSYNTDMQEFLTAGRVRMASYQNPQQMISISCVYASNTMADALGTSNVGGSFRWVFRVGDIWRFWKSGDASDRGGFDNTLNDFQNTNYFLESGSAANIPSTDRWNLNLQLKRYIDSAVMSSAKISSLTGEVIAPAVPNN